MPHVTENQDGTKTFSINSSELRLLKNLFARRAPDIKKVAQIVETPEFQATLDFLKTVFAGPAKRS